MLVVVLSSVCRVRLAVCSSEAASRTRPDEMIVSAARTVAAKPQRELTLAMSRSRPALSAASIRSSRSRTGRGISARIGLSVQARGLRAMTESRLMGEA